MTITYLFPAEQAPNSIFRDNYLLLIIIIDTVELNFQVFNPPISIVGIQTAEPLEVPMIYTLLVHEHSG